MPSSAPSESEKIYIVLMKTEKGVYIVCGEGRGEAIIISAAKTEKELIDSLEESYRRKHLQSYEGSMSAAMNWMAYQPSVIGTTLNDLKIVCPPPIKAFSLWGVAGGFDGILIPDETEALKLWESGKKPALIKNEWLPS